MDVCQEEGGLDLGYHIIVQLNVNISKDQSAEKNFLKENFSVTHLLFDYTQGLSEMFGHCQSPRALVRCFHHGG